MNLVCLEINCRGCQAIKDCEGIQTLPSKQQSVMLMYYYEGLNLREIGEVLNVTDARISQLHSKAIESLKDLFATHFESSIDLAVA